MSAEAHEEDLFDSSAAAFAHGIDRAIATGKYVRGRLFVEAARRHARPGSKVLDFGCGPGRIARLLALAGYSVCGVDPSRGMLAQAQAQPLSGLDIRFDCWTGTIEALERDAYDLVVCSSVIEYVSDPGQLLRGFWRALRPNGALLLSYSNSRSLWRAYSAWRYRDKLPHLAREQNIWSFADCARHLRDAGFQLSRAPTFFEASPFDKRVGLRFFSRSRWIGTLGLVEAVKRIS